MSNKQEIASSLNEIWGKLSTRWTEVAEDFEEACSNLSVGAGDLAKKLELIEHDIT